MNDLQIQNELETHIAATVVWLDDHGISYDLVFIPGRYQKLDCMSVIDLSKDAPVIMATVIGRNNDLDLCKIGIEIGDGFSKARNFLVRDGDLFTASGEVPLGRSTPEDLLKFVQERFSRDLGAQLQHRLENPSIG